MLEAVPKLTTNPNINNQVMPWSTCQRTGGEGGVGDLRDFYPKEWQPAREPKYWPFPGRQ